MSSVVHHFGPDPSTVGGIATVIRLYTEHRVGGDVVVGHPTWRPRSPSSTAKLVTRAAWALMRMKRGEIAHVHLSERGSFLREGAFVALAHRRRGIVTVVTIHGASFMPFAQRYPRLATAVLRRAQLVICLDRDTLGFVRAHAPRAHCALLANPVELDESFPPADATEELVVFAGEIRLRKGADVLSRAWPTVARRRPQARCLMVGPIIDFTPERAERLEIRPAVGASEMKQILTEARVVTLPSREEGMPMVLTEAMSLARPFVSTPVGGIPELAAAGGMLVAVEDETALADRLTDLLQDPALARTIGERGRRFCVQTRGVEVIDAQLRDLYAAVAAG